MMHFPFRKISILSVAGILSCTMFVFAAPKGPHYDGIRAMGMGNTSVAVSTDRTAIFHNPAGLGLLKDDFELSLAPAVVSVDKELFNLLDVLVEQGPKLSDMSLIKDGFFDSFNKMDGIWADIQYLPEFTLAKKNFGFGMYSVWPLGVRIETGHFIPKLGIRGERDLVFTWAVGIPLKNESNQFGISMAYLQRVPVDEYITTYSETFLLYDNVEKNPLSMLGTLGDYANVKHGACFDVGFMHNFGGFRLGYTLKNIFGVIGGEMVIPELNLGCAYYFPAAEKVSWIRNMIVAFDINDIWGQEARSGQYEQFAKKLHLGAELDLGYFALRGGINQGYLTGGVGLHAGIVSLDYVYFNEEAGFYAGQEPKPRHVISLGMAIRVKKNKSNGDDTTSTSVIAE